MTTTFNIVIFNMYVIYSAIFLDLKLVKPIDNLKQNILRNVYVHDIKFNVQNKIGISENLKL